MSGDSGRIIVAGHVCLDVIPTFHPRADGSSPEIRPGHLVQVGHAVRSTGGAVSNTGLALHRLGIPVRLIGKIGNDLFGEEILRLFQAAGSGIADGMVQVPGETTSYSIVISPPGIDRTFLHCPGANNSFSADDVSNSVLSDACLFHFGYPPVMESMWRNDGRELIRLFRKVHEQGLTTSLDLCMVDATSEVGQIDWETILAGVLPSVDLFCPSVDELLFMLDRTTYQAMESDGGFSPGRHVSLSLLRQLSEQCLKYGAGAVAIKLGDQGFYLRSSSDAIRIQQMGRGLRNVIPQWIGCELYSPCYQANVVGTTGSGDCTIAGFLAAIFRNDSPTNAVRSAVATGAASVEAADAVSGVPHWDRISERIQTGWNQHPPLFSIS